MDALDRKNIVALLRKQAGEVSRKPVPQFRALESKYVP